MDSKAKISEPIYNMNNAKTTGGTASVFAGLAAILGGACCWGLPLLTLLGVGASTGGILGSVGSFIGVITPYRNYFLLFNFVGLALSFYFIYLRPFMLLRRATSKDTEDNQITCDCESENHGKFNFSKFSFFLSLGITIGILIYLQIDAGQIFMQWPSI